MKVLFLNLPVLWIILPVSRFESMTQSRRRVYQLNPWASRRLLILIALLCYRVGGHFKISANLCLTHIGVSYWKLPSFVDFRFLKRWELVEIELCRSVLSHGFISALCHLHPLSLPGRRSYPSYFLFWTELPCCAQRAKILQLRKNIHDFKPIIF